MATKVLTTLQDDIDGSDATQTIRFALDGIEYEIKCPIGMPIGSATAWATSLPMGARLAAGARVDRRHPARLIPRPSGSGPKPMASRSVAVDVSQLK